MKSYPIVHRLIITGCVLGIAIIASASEGKGAANAAGASIGSPAPGFSIADQLDQPVSLSSYLGKPVLVIYGDRKGSDYMGAWVQPVKPAIKEAGANSSLHRCIVVDEGLINFAAEGRASARTT